MNESQLLQFFEKNTSQIDTHSVGRCAFNVLTGSCLISNDSLILSTNKMQLYPLNWLSVVLSIVVHFFFSQFFSQNEREKMLHSNESDATHDARWESVIKIGNKREMKDKEIRAKCNNFFS